MNIDELKNYLKGRREDLLAEKCKLILSNRDDYDRYFDIVERLDELNMIWDIYRF